MNKDQAADPKEAFETLEAELRKATDRLEDASVPLEERLRLHTHAAGIQKKLEAALERASRTLAEPVEEGAAPDDEPYETLRDRLAETVATLEDEELPLVRVVELHRRARELAARCEAKLNLAQERVDQTLGPGEAGSRPVEPDPWSDSGDQADANNDPAPF